MTLLLVTCSVCLYSIRLSHSIVVLQQQQQQQQHYGNSGNANLQQSSGRSDLSSSSSSLFGWWDDLTLEGSTSCDAVRSNVAKGLWKDPNNNSKHHNTNTTAATAAAVGTTTSSNQDEHNNGGQYYIRRIDEPPHHFVSVHNKDYDRVRFTSIFNRGTYYEHKVHARFVSILSEEQEQGSAHTDNNATTTTITTKTISSPPLLPIVMDVGANIGYYSLLSAAMHHAVVSFEINPSNLVRLCESISWNHHQQYGDHHPHSQSSLSSSSASSFAPIRIFRNGVSNVHNDTVRIRIPKRNPGEASVDVPPQAQAVVHNEQTRQALTDHYYARTVTLDQFATEHGWLSKNIGDAATATTAANVLTIAILKIDTEGHEPYILQGAKELLRSGMVRNVLLEYRAVPTCRQAVMETLLDTGYVLVYDEPHRDDYANNRRGRTMLTKEASRGYIVDKLRDDNNHNNHHQNGTATVVYKDLWFRLATHKLPLATTKATTRSSSRSRVRPQQQGLS